MQRKACYPRKAWATSVRSGSYWLRVGGEGAHISWGSHTQLLTRNPIILVSLPPLLNFAKEKTEVWLCWAIHLSELHLAELHLPRGRRCLRSAWSACRRCLRLWHRAKYNHILKDFVNWEIQHKYKECGLRGFVFFVCFVFLHYPRLRA